MVTLNAPCLNSFCFSSCYLIFRKKEKKTNTRGRRGTLYSTRGKGLGQKSQQTTNSTRSNSNYCFSPLLKRLTNNTHRERECERERAINNNHQYSWFVWKRKIGNKWKKRVGSKNPKDCLIEGSSWCVVGLPHLSRERIIIGKVPGTAIAGCDGYRWEKNPREEEETCKAKRVEWVLIDLSKAWWWWWWCRLRCYGVRWSLARLLDLLISVVKRVTTTRIETGNLFRS